MNNINKMIYGTSNLNKLEDIKAIIKAHGENIEILSLKDIGFYEEIEETGTTFEENSEIKANAVKAFCDKNKIDYDIITTDDAGLCVDCLNGEPGVYSARYAGGHSNQEQCIEKLLTNIEKTGDTEDKRPLPPVLPLQSAVSPHTVPGSPYLPGYLPSHPAEFLSPTGLPGWIRRISAFSRSGSAPACGTDTTPDRPPW